MRCDVQVMIILNLLILLFPFNNNNNNIHSLNSPPVTDYGNNNSYPPSSYGYDDTSNSEQSGIRKFAIKKQAISIPIQADYKQLVSEVRGRLLIPVTHVYCSSSSSSSMSSY